MPPTVVPGKGRHELVGLAVTTGYATGHDDSGSGNGDYAQCRYQTAGFGESMRTKSEGLLNERI
jgi:hypothetical protein